MCATPKTERERFDPVFQTKTKTARVFVSYKRDAEPDESMAHQVVAGLEKAGHEVFIDRKMLVGVQWAEEIERQIRESDFLVVLLTAESCRSEGILGEIEKTRRYFAEIGRPRILPIRLAFLEELPYPLNGWLDKIQYALWRGEDETPALVEQLNRAIQGTAELAESGETETGACDKVPRYFAPLPRPGGAVPIEDPLWVARSADQRAIKLAAQPGQTIVLKAPRQMGKTSLLYRMAQKAQDEGKDVVFIDLQLFGRELFQNAISFYQGFAAALAEQLEAASPQSGYWDVRSSQPTACTQYVERQILQKAAKPIVLAIDEADLLISSAFREDFFGMLRAWHGLRANPLKKVWKKMDLYLVTSTEPAFLIQGTQSPFNVSPPVVLERFTAEHIRWLNEEHGSPLNASELERLLRLVGGHPYLTRLALYEVSGQGGAKSPAQLFASVTDEAGPFGSHLRRFLLNLIDMPEVLTAFRDILTGRGGDDAKLNYRLEAAGLITMHNGRAVPSCELYHDYFRERLR